MATIDGDTTDVEVYGSKKQDAVYNYLGSGLPAAHRVLGEGGSTLAADLMRADGDPRRRGGPARPGHRGVAPGVGKVQCRWDSGYFAGDLARHCLTRNVDFAIGVKRNTAVGRACRIPPKNGWHPAIGMAHTEVAVIEYLPAAGPPTRKCPASLAEPGSR